MKFSILNITLFTVICAITFTFPQNLIDEINHSHMSGLQSLKTGNTEEAISYFKVAVDSFSFADSYYELAKIYFDKNTVQSRTISRKYIQKAIWKDETNIEYRLLQAKLMEKFSRKMAYHVYQNILNIDANCTEALFNLGKIKELDFYEYNNSVLKVGSDPSLSFDEFAIEDYLQAEGFFKRTIKSDSTCLAAYFHLSCLYQEIEDPQKGIPLIKKIIAIDPDNKQAYTYLGLLYYKTSQMDSSNFAYKNALKLMDEKQKNEFKYQSSSFLVDESLRKKFNNFSSIEFEESIEKFWQSSDPLLLTNYNERLLEHYSRVAYSNLKFSVPENELYGWNTDRGEILIRYGEPANRLRYRPYISAGGRTSLKLKTDLWFYKDKVLGFVDEYWNGNFRFSTTRPYSRHISQFAGDTDFFVKDLRRNEPENYEPKFIGPSINVPYNVVQFKNLDGNSRETDVYVNYAMNLSNLFNPDDKFPIAHKYGLFLLDGKSYVRNKKTDLLLKTKPEKNIKLGLNEEYQINSIGLKTKPDSLKMAFEIMRISDNAVSANHFYYKIKSFSIDELDISDILLSEEVNESGTSLAIKRGKLNILPNPLNEFTSISSIYIYYEVYNLSLDKNKTANFEQRVTLSKLEVDSGVEEIWSSVTDFFGFTNEEDKLTLINNYKAYNKNVPVYFQIDMSKYSKGNYILSIEVEDMSHKTTVTSETMLRWR
ncbi:MAG: GWxTD domain-containing protein [Ignavibacteria bacterium]|nr:GWxTD domain-containing protein [Ignavibacteria bacterium]MBT8381042.1 GWxTD domain-containing protein [Ignavibacteria bacterium]MBT8393045.1 GWxTD domain-containing protein [Ignavibacteria bacterium]NNL19729.1 GWxTD domain-containing protein [Ignavibacteriaceae bacterium]